MTASDNPDSNRRRALAAMRESARRETLANFVALNRESRLGCVLCHGPLTDGRCPGCQP